MNTQETINYQRVAEAIDYIQNNFKEQPDLNEVAKQIHVSPFHFQRLFTQWAGVSPKKFMQYLSVEHAKTLLKEKHSSLMDAAYETGFSGTGRLHDLFIKIEGMTPGEYKNGGENLRINYSVAESPFGNILVGSTIKGICYMAFADDSDKAFEELDKMFPNAKFKRLVDRVQQNALQIFNRDWSDLKQIRLHIKGTPFQLKVWEALLKIPRGQLETYSGIAKSLESPGASRAVGSAVGDNPVAYLIPCHRIIQSTGVFGNYHWGPTRKSAIIGWESAGRDMEENSLRN